MLNIKNLLNDHGIKASMARIKIYEYLYNNRTHPNVDTIYNDLVKDLPTLSRTTVYNTLKVFEEYDIVNSLSLNKNEMIYDLNDFNHSHFKCIKCGNVYDIHLEDINFDNLNKQGFKVTNKSVYVTGICPSCKNKLQ